MYHGLQHLKGSIQAERDLKTKTKTFQDLTKILGNDGFRGLKILEIGSGWFPTLPYLMVYRGHAGQVTTIDQNQHYSRRRISLIHSHFEAETGQTQAFQSGSWPLAPQISYLPQTDLLTYPFRYKYDLILTRHTLEHVRPDFLHRFHEQAHRLLAASGKIIHLISPSDHRAYDDPQLTLIDFLRFSENEWNAIQTRFDYHNRWRLPEYLDCFTKHNWKIEFLDYQLPSKPEKIAEIKAVPLDPHFQGLSFEELVAGSIKVILTSNHSF